MTLPGSSGSRGIRIPALKRPPKSTRDFWRSAEESPGNQGYHCNRNAETYMLVGDALGRGMIKLLEKEKQTCIKQ